MKDDRIGIITFHNTLNYGAHLQAYALCQFFKDRGYFCEIIDYRCKAITDVYDLHFWKHFNSIAGFMQYLLSVSDLKKKKQKFEEFLVPYYSDKVYVNETKEDMNFEYDRFIVGSDQVWNTELTENDITFFLDFVKKRTCISYAASIGKNHLTDEDIKIFKKYLNKFDRISVREDTALNLLQEIGMEHVEQMIDPTFLISKKVWLNIANKAVRYRIKEKYVLVYEQGRGTYGLTFAKQLAREKGIDIVIVHAYARKYRGVKNIRDASLEEFLYLIIHADCVVTTSFHGMALSLILEKDFYYEEKSNINNANSRLQSLARLFKIENRRIIQGMNKTAAEKIDYQFVRKVIEEQQKRTESFFEIDK